MLKNILFLCFGLLTLSNCSFAQVETCDSAQLVIAGDSVEVFESFQVEEQAQFPGGSRVLDKYIAENMKYPPIAIENGASGAVFIRFVVEKDGSLSSFKIVSPKKLVFGLEEEVLRVFKAMPKWKPATQDGEHVRMTFVKPVRFSFE